MFVVFLLRAFIESVVDTHVWVCVFYAARFYRVGRRYTCLGLCFYAARVYRVGRRYRSMFTKIDVHIAWRCVVRFLFGFNIKSTGTGSYRAVSYTHLTLPTTPYV